MKRFFVLAVTAGVPFGVFMGLFSAWLSGSDLGFRVGLLSGAFFGIAMAVTLIAFRKRLLRHPPVITGEEILFRSPANHFRGSEGVGGWLVLTEKRLLFRPHAFNVQKEEWSLPLTELVDLQPKRTAWVVPNGLRAVTRRGEERFVVDERMRWVSEVQRAKAKTPNE